MTKQFKFPDVGEGITEGEIVKWRVKEGDEVEEDQTLADIETDKAVVEVPSPYSGTVLKLHFKEDDIVKVGETLVTIGNGEVSKEKCLHCHWNTEKFNNTPYQHRKHITDYQDFTKPGISCFDCHDRIEHGDLRKLVDASR